MLQAEQYQFPDDLRMLAELNRLQRLRAMAAQFIREFGEPWISGTLTGMGIRVSARQFPEIHAQAETLAALYGLPTPRLYLVNDSRLNAYTHGLGNQCFVALTSALVREMDAEGLAFILGHELGHIQCQHVLYTTMVSWMLEDTWARGNRETQELLMTMLGWVRTSEISADRAGLLACGSKEVAARTLLTLAVGSRQLAEQIDIPEYVAEQSLSLEYNPVALRRQHMESHPYMPFRLSELLKYAECPGYQQLADDMIRYRSGLEGPINIDLF